MGSLLAAYVNPHTFIIPAFLGLAFPFLLIGHVLVCVFYFILTRSKLIFVFIIPLLASLPVFCNFFGVNFSTSSKGTDKNQFRLMTYNVHYFAHRDSVHVYVNAGIYELMRQENPDIICMQDFVYAGKREAAIDSIRRILRMPYYYTGPAKGAISNHELAVFSRFPIVDTGYIQLAFDNSGNQCIFADIKRGNQVFRVYNVHFQSLKFQPQDYERWDNGNAKNKASFLRHNFRRLQYAFLLRSSQVEIMKNEINACKIPSLVAGDFNDSPASYAVNEMSRGLKNTFREKAKGYKVTYNGDMPNFQIDYIMTKPVFQINSYKVIESKLSDHYPVSVDVSL